MMDSPNGEGKNVRTSAGIRNGAGKTRVAAAESVTGCGEPYSAVTSAATIATVRSGTGNAGRIGKRMRRGALAQVSRVAKPDTILRWYQKLITEKFDGSKHGYTLGGRVSVARWKR